MLLRFRLKGVDDLISFILAVIDIIYVLVGMLNYILYLSASGKFQEDRAYCIVTRLMMDCFSTVGLNTVVVLAIVRYLAICKKLVLSKPLALTIILTISSIPITGLLICIYNNQPILNAETPTCPIDIPFDSVYNKLTIWLNVHPLIYLMVITACYIQIMRYYSKMELVLSECEAACSANSNIETSKDIQAYPLSPIQSESSQNSDKTSINSCSLKTFSLADTVKSQKFLPMLKVTLIILIYYIELLPYYSIQTYFSITNKLEGISELGVQVTLMLLDLTPLTNTFLILFIHEETWQELRLWGVVWSNWIKRRLNF
ncbi:hypothetical protein CONCODRAFT_11740 [Conidiobolus coronatus NRRL 28638]|uniref:G-protein coupled receptors family 1 profile domain-containing protein n=1 Tax=Conidiobolus coronatus (strain ATCC 28846 / CBS 209.66 / NRRL 28638) TaxID=796925 RepID=A0A137NUN7_CONC2|nr:hypothetical protein CONCODRAFT_11740 [Conidiobolus coronatus NRRL 28638]|eukprot:KXN66432.1 hypothetical protein CONCODRAFT_11740 [Conidiobolus coronatus NRRL 28638]